MPKYGHAIAFWVISRIFSSPGTEPRKYRQWTISQSMIEKSGPGIKDKIDFDHFVELNLLQKEI